MTGGELGAACAIVSSIDPTKPYLRYGRVVLSSASLMVLWNPATGVARRVPIAGMEVSSTDDAGLTAVASGTKMP